VIEIIRAAVRALLTFTIILPGAIILPSLGINVAQAQQTIVGKWAIRSMCGSAVDDRDRADDAVGRGFLASSIR